MILLIRLSKIIIISYLLILLSFVNFSNAEPQDIWKKSREIKIENKKKIEIKQDNKLNQDLPQTIFDKQKINLSINKVDQSNDIKDKEIIFGLYEPQDTKIGLNFWSSINSNTYDRFSKNILQTQSKSSIQISEKILFTKTNIASFPDGGSKHLALITEWLIKNKKINIADQVVKQNKTTNNNAGLIKFLFLYHLSQGKVDLACNYTNLRNAYTQSVELDKYKIFCLVHNKKIKQALTQLELIRETNSLDSFFIKKINFLAGISNDQDIKNFDNIFNAHLTLKAYNEIDIKFENFSKNKNLRNYFFKSGIANRLLNNTLNKSSSDDKQKLNELVVFLERSANEDLYEGKKILEIYKKYNFSFDQLFTVSDSVQKLQRPESHAILYQAMLLAQKPETKLKILTTLREKLTLNGLEKIAEPIYFDELAKILNVKKELLNQNMISQLEIYKINQNKNNREFDNSFIYSSQLKQLLNKEVSKKNKKKILKLLNLFDKKIKDKKYKVNKKDIAFINVLKKEKVDLPGSLLKFIYSEKVYIPNEIFNAIKNKSNNEALLKTLIIIGNLNEKSNNYTRDVLAILKIFDKINKNDLKQIFIINEFSL